jgi:peptide deformylase
LAAPQVGVNLKPMVFNPEGERGQELVLANPKIVSTGKREMFEQEGCLSFKNSSGVFVLGDVEVHMALHCNPWLCVLVIRTSSVLNEFNAAADQ